MRTREQQHDQATLHVETSLACAVAILRCQVVLTLVVGTTKVSGSANVPLISSAPTPEHLDVDKHQHDKIRGFGKKNHKARDKSRMEQSRFIISAACQLSTGNGDCRRLFI